MLAFSLPFLPFALLILQHCLTAAHPIKAPARIDLQPLLTLMQMSSAQLISVALGAAGWSSGFRGNFESTRKAALLLRSGCGSSSSTFPAQRAAKAAANALICRLTTCLQWPAACRCSSSCASVRQSHASRLFRSENSFALALATNCLTNSY